MCMLKRVGEEKFVKQASARGPISCLIGAGYTGDACEVCGDGYALGSGLCQRTLESFQAQAALAGKPAQLPLAPAPAPIESPLAKALFSRALL